MNRSHFLKFFTGSVATVVMAGFFASAHAQGKPTGDGGTVRIMINPAGTMGIGPAVIKKYGFDTKHGFNLEVVSYSDQ
ncbi:MAG: hypothetical protein EOO22_06820, partial [Comamonadaceae bacterium]